MKTITIIDLNGKPIELTDPHSTLKQLEIFLELLESQPGILKDELPAVYWINLHEKLKAVVK